MMAADAMQISWQLSELLEGLVRLPPQQDTSVQGLAIDSRRVRPGDLFLACVGAQRHGLEFVADAVRAGAAAVVWEPSPRVAAAPEVAGGRKTPMVSVPFLGERVGIIADRFYGHPCRDLYMVGVAGTDGKTSCSHFIAQMLGTDETPCGVIGTLGYGPYGQLESGSHTTPDPVTLHARLAQFRDRRLRTVVMEVSSHALDQDRVSGVDFDVALFTNLGRDHLDYHGDVEAYGLAKRRFFESPALKTAVLNADDPFSQEIAAVLPAGTGMVAYGLQQLPDWVGQRAAHWVLGRNCRVESSGIRMDVESSWGSGRLCSGLLGAFNGHNLLGTLAVALVAGLDFSEALRRANCVQAIAGRMERFGGRDGRPLVVVDYAHTPQSLEHALQALRDLCKGSVWCVFGAGGERDRGKRHLMGEIAERCADHVVLTDDNPRREDPASIVADILQGMHDPDAAQVEHDRAAAIRIAVGAAGSSDAVLVAGKGHELYQQFGDRQLPFDDRREVAALLEDVRS